MKKPFLLGIMVLMAIGLVCMSSPPVAESQAARPNLVRNPSFETPNVVPEGEIFTQGETIGAWTVRSGSVQLLGNAFRARTGLRFVGFGSTEFGPVIDAVTVRVNN